jgi:hypothetical protein
MAYHHFWKFPTELPEKVALIKHKGKIIGLSNVYDYIYRPTELEDMTLFDWIGRCKRTEYITAKKAIKEPLLDEDNSDVEEAHFEEEYSHDEIDEINSPPIEGKNKSISKFTSEHPLVQSHGLRCISADQALIPNFVGRTLPHCDQGDREYYCTTMLTLFKPWRTGAELKSKESSWDETFNSHEFTAQQVLLMKNFNIRYECLDQKDDFFAELKKGGTALPSWMEDKSLMQEISQDCILDQLDQLAVDHMNMDEIESDNQLSKRYHDQKRSMSIMKNIMIRLGWTNVHPENASCKLDIKGTQVSGIKSASDWNTVVVSRRQEILEERTQHAPEILYNSSDTGGIGIISNDVKVVDKEYMDKKFHSPDWQDSINLVVWR